MEYRVYDQGQEKWANGVVLETLEAAKAERARLEALRDEMRANAEEWKRQADAKATGEIMRTNEPWYRWHHDWKGAEFVVVCREVGSWAPC